MIRIYRSSRNRKGSGNKPNQNAFVDLTNNENEMDTMTDSVRNTPPNCNTMNQSTNKETNTASTNNDDDQQAGTMGNDGTMDVEDDDGPIIGVDLGTTNWCISQIKDDMKAEIILDPSGQPTTPSAIMFRKVEETIEYSFGQQAKDRKRRNDNKTVVIWDWKRTLGRKYVLSSLCGHKSNLYLSPKS